MNPSKCIYALIILETKTLTLSALILILSLVLISHTWGEKVKNPNSEHLEGRKISISCFINTFQINGNYTAQGG